MTMRTQPALRDFARYVLEEATDLDLDAIVADLRTARLYAVLHIRDQRNPDPDTEAKVTSVDTTLTAMIEGMPSPVA